MIRIIIGGDICPIGKNEKPFIEGDVEGIFKDFLEEFRDCDLALINLECPLVDQESPIKKTGPVLSAPENCINGIREANIGVVNLANNHIMDHGSTGLLNTIRICEKNGIATVGVGRHVRDARKILIRKINDVSIGILACAEHEFSIATNDSPGANPLDIIDCLRNVKESRNLFDYLILLLHGGKELYSYPTPNLIKTCRFLAEEFADAIVCQHSHCPVCYEIYNGVPIVYGQGNLIFEGDISYKKAWNEGFLVRLNIDKNTSSRLDILPYVQSYKSYGVNLMSPDEKKHFMSDLKNRSDAIQDLAFVEKQWKEYCTKNKYVYLSLMLGHGRLRRYLNRKFHFSDFIFSSRSRRQALNVIRCETHREILETILRY